MCVCVSLCDCFWLASVARYASNEVTEYFKKEPRIVSASCLYKVSVKTTHHIKYVMENRAT